MVLFVRTINRGQEFLLILIKIMSFLKKANLFVLEMSSSKVTVSMSFQLINFWIDLKSIHRNKVFIIKKVSK